MIFLIYGFLLLVILKLAVSLCLRLVIIVILNGILHKATCRLMVSYIIVGFCNCNV